MLVKIVEPEDDMVFVKATSPGAESAAESVYSEWVIECDQVKKFMAKEHLRLILFRHGKCIETLDFDSKVRIYFTVEGKTVDKIEFKLNS